ncbi:MAG: toprim domain-containing protein [Pseudomonadota bacterium]
MNSAIQKELLTALDREFSFKKSGDWLRQGKCPDCGKKELYTHAVSPKVLKCGRLNRCGYERSVRDYFPEIFDDWSKRFKASERDPNAAADAYLSHSRGFDLQGLRGSYTQEYYRDQDRNIGSATIRFPLPGGSWWERLIDQPGRFDRKARFAPGKSYQGQCWTPPGIDMAALAASERFAIAEGIFDALAWRASGETAVSSMSCNNYPEAFLRALRKAISEGKTPEHSPQIIFAYDVGKAGLDYTRKFVERARKEGWNASAAQVTPDGDGVKLDWNDLFLHDRMSAEHIADYLWNGEVAIAPNATEKAALLYERRKWGSFNLFHDSRTWWASFSAERIAEVMLKEKITERAAIRACAKVVEIANCSFRTLYRERDEVIDDTAYYLRIDFPGKHPMAKGRFSSAQLTAAPEFKKRLFAFGGMFTGTTGQLDRLMQVQTRELKTVEPIDFTGYSRRHKAWVFGDIAVRNGRVHHLNDEDYFDFGRDAIKLRTAERLLEIDYDPDRLDTSWLSNLWIAYGPKGIVALAFWQLSFFAEQIREAQKSLAFLEVTGEPGSGKSTLLEFLWRLCGRDSYEGFDPTKATTAAIARNLGKVANLPVALIEGDRRDDVPHSKRFEWDELKTAYNGRAVRSRGVRNGGNETYDPPFRGAIVIAQNYRVDASPALLERLMCLTIDKTGWSAATKRAAEEIERWPLERLSAFIVHVTRREDAWMEAYRKGYSTAETTLPEMSGINHQRLIKNHAQLAGALDALASIVELPADWVHSAHAMIARMVAERHQAITADHPIVASFWETVDWLVANETESTPVPLNLARDPEKNFAVSLNAFEERCRTRGISSAPTQDQLKKHLRGSKTRRFLATKSVNTITGKSVHCWVFQQPGSGAAPTKERV